MKLHNMILAFGLSALLGLSACGEQKTNVPNAPAAQLMSSNSGDEVSDEVKPKKTRKAKAEVPFSGEPVDVNTATAEELVATLKGTGVGAAKVKNIIAYREEHGGFKNIDELNEVKGIGDKTLEKIRPRVTISGKASSSKTKVEKKASKASAEHDKQDESAEKKDEE